MSPYIAAANSLVPDQTQPWKGGVLARNYLFSVTFGPCTHRFTNKMNVFDLSFLNVRIILAAKVVPNENLLLKPTFANN